MNLYELNELVNGSYGLFSLVNGELKNFSPKRTKTSISIVPISGLWTKENEFVGGPDYRAGATAESGDTALETTVRERAITCNVVTVVARVTVAGGGTGTKQKLLRTVSGGNRQTATVVTNHYRAAAAAAAATSSSQHTRFDNSSLHAQRNIIIIITARNNNKNNGTHRIRTRFPP